MQVEFKAELDVLSITVGCTTNREIFKLIQAIMGLLSFNDVQRHRAAVAAQIWLHKQDAI
jgi:hypothetical protein